MAVIPKVGAVIHGIWAIPLVLIMRLIRPIILIRVGTFLSNRIGHYVADTAHHWILYNLNITYREVNLFWLEDYTCNAQWTKIVKRNLPVYSWVKYVDIWNKFIPKGDAHNLVYFGSRDTEGLLENSNVEMMQLLPTEEAKAKRWLRSKGWTDGEPFVCLIVRDSAYLNSVNSLNEYDFSYHSYRDSDIDTYVLAIEWLANQGVWVLRMGKKMRKQVYSQHKKIIDYAFDSQKSDLLDVWLFSNCSLCISSATGVDFLSDIFRRPMLLLNYLPINDLISWSNSLHYPKKLIWKNTQKMLNLSEYMRHGYSHTENYSSAGIGIVDLTEEEIINAVQEAWRDVLSNKTTRSDNCTYQQEKFWEIMRSMDLYKKNHDFIHPMSCMSSVFLELNKEFLQ